MIEKLTVSANTTVWQIIAEFSCPAHSGCEQEVIQMVFKAIDSLISPSPWHDRLTKAISRATSKAKERAGKNGEIHVRVFASEKALEGEDKQPSNRNSEHTQAQKPSQGWNFFLVERSLPCAPEDSALPEGKTRHVMEIFLYIEG